MARTIEGKYQNARDRVKAHSTRGEHEVLNGKTEVHLGYEDPEDADRILRMDDAYNEGNLGEKCPDGQKTKALSTRKNYLTTLNKIAPHVALTDTSAEELNKGVLQGFYDGTHENVKDGGLSKGTVRQYQNAVRQFYYVFDDVGVDPEDIPLFTPDEASVDPDDMLTRDEMTAIRNAATCMRDRALFDFLLWTGQRNTATRTLRIDDLDLPNERFRLNPEAEGLKDAEKNGKWRDLLLSASSVRQYLNTEHPAPEDPEAYVFVARPKYGKTKPRTMLDETTVGSVIKKMADRAAEEKPSIRGKPTHPHALRHNFVTEAVRQGMDEAAIKHQLGHKPESTIMESTYAHLTDDDHIRNAREAFDLETEDVESPLTPHICPQCGETPPADARLCPWCGKAFTPGSKEVLEEAEGAVSESYRQVDPEDSSAVEKAQLIDELLDDPEVREEIASRREE